MHEPDALAPWRTADQAARQAEQAVLALLRGGGRPSVAQLEELVALRRHALRQLRTVLMVLGTPPGA